MNTGRYVLALADNLKAQYASGGIPLSEACWQEAIACVEMAYVYGAWGKECTPAYRKDRYKYNQVESIKEKCQVLRSSSPKSGCIGCKWFPDEERTLCWDCRGFTRWVIEMITGFQLYGQMVSTQWGASQNWCAKGTVKEGIPQGVLVCLFIFNGEKWTHTGLYFNGQTCEASNGV